MRTDLAIGPLKLYNLTEMEGRLSVVHAATGIGCF